MRYRHRPEPVRRVVSREVAVALRSLLRGVVERGTGNRSGAHQLFPWRRRPARRAAS